MKRRTTPTPTPGAITPPQPSAAFSRALRAVLAALTLTLAAALPATAQQYTVHSVTGDVKLKKGMKMLPAAKGTAVSPADILELAEGSTVAIFNSANNQTYEYR